MTEFSITLPKRCTRCGDYHPPTIEFFQRKKSRKDGLSPYCKTCKRTIDKKWHENHPGKKSEYDRQYREAHVEEISISKRVYREEHAEYLSQYFKDHHIKNRAQRNAKTAAWREQHPEYIANYGRANRERSNILRRQRYKNNPLVSTISRLKRRATAKGLPSDFTQADWKRCLEYWDNRCCVCGRQPDFWHTLAKEHWIPLADKRIDNPGTVVTNILPMCHSKRGVMADDSSCNNLKGNKDPVEWLYARYDKRNADAILSAITAYFKQTVQECLNAT